MSPVESVACGLCGGEDRAPLYREGEWQIVRCRSCGHHYTHPRPTLESLSSYYDAEYFADPDRYPVDSTTTPLHPRRAADVESHVGARGRLLEIGPGYGTFLASMRLRGWTVEGIEFSADAVRIARERYGLELFYGTIEDYAPSDPYDAICLYQSLEHLGDPAAVVRTCRRWLRPGGILVIEVPHARSFDMRGNAERTRLSYDLPRHLHHFTPGPLARCLRSEGYRILEVDRHLPEFALRLAERARNARVRPGKADRAPAPRLEADGGGPLPLMHKPKHWKARIEQAVSRLFPGWRFTIVAQRADQPPSD